MLGTKEKGSFIFPEQYNGSGRSIGPEEQAEKSYAGVSTELGAVNEQLNDNTRLQIFSSVPD